MTPGHVFVVNGSLENLDRDAQVIPTDRSFTVEPTWRGALGVAAQDDFGARLGELRPSRWGEVPMAAATRHPDTPTWFFEVAPRHLPVTAADVTTMLRGLHAGLVSIATSAVLEARSGRSHPLIALPVLGVRHGGFGAFRAEVIDGLLGTCEDVVRERAVDLVVVCFHPADYAAFQDRRRRGYAHALNLSASEARLAADLAVRAREGELALFIGAGVSMSAGLPSWKILLHELEMKSGSPLPNTTTMSDLDRAELIRRRFTGTAKSPDAVAGDLGSAVIKIIGRRSRYGLAHALLTGLGCEQVITTNYDDLYERAYDDGRRARRGDEEIPPLTVLPFDAARGRLPWLLKMHGDVRDATSIVLSRADFVRYDSLSRPMGAIVQAILMTKHLLVVGASLRDDNLLRLTHEVIAFREAGGRPSAPLGTVLKLEPDPTEAELWEGRFDIRALESGWDVGPAAQARHLTVFLDAVAMHAAHAGHLADQTYDALLDSDDERAVADQARRLRDAIAQLPDGSSWSQVDRTLREAGAPQIRT